MTGQEILARAREDNVRLISLQFTDVPGTTKSLMIPVERLPDAIKEGIWFGGSCRVSRRPSTSAGASKTAQR